MSSANMPSVALQAPRRDPEALRACLFGLFAAPLGWFVQLCAGYGFASWPCFASGQRATAALAGYEWTRSAMLVISVCGVVLASAGCLACLRVLRRARTEAERVPPLERWAHGSERSCFLALWGVAFGGGSALSALISTVAQLMLPRCAG